MYKDKEMCILPVALNTLESLMGCDITRIRFPGALSGSTLNSKQLALKI